MVIFNLVLELLFFFPNFSNKKAKDQKKYYAKRKAAHASQ